MHIINDFGFELIVHCKSRDDDLAPKLLTWGRSTIGDSLGSELHFFSAT
ncbi:hypothetical protein LINPERPRIM_LOCUS26321 [Linum perenne]